METYEDGEIVFDIDEVSDHFYFLHSGRIRLDTSIEVQHIAKWPCEEQKIHWNVSSKKVLKTLEYKDAPDLVGQIDVIWNQRPRVNRAVAIGHVVLLKAKAGEIFKYLS